MNIQAIIEKANSLKGCLSGMKTTESRKRHVEKEDMLNVDIFVGDESKIDCSKAWRRMKHLTQVFTAPHNPFMRTRQDHVQEVVAVSNIISEMLGLNTNLVRAAGLGHDIGHVPLGHQGEEWIQIAMDRPDFCHEKMGPIRAQKIERKGMGMNLSWHTLDAMKGHSGDTAYEGMSQEAWTLRHGDKFAYVFHDIEDIGKRMDYPFSEELISLTNEFGSSQRERTTTAICGLIIESAEIGKVSFEQSEIALKFKKLRGMMYDVYVCVTQQDVESFMQPALDFLTRIKMADPFLLLTLMTDKDVLLIKEWKGMNDMQLFKQLSISEMAPYLRTIGKVDLCDPDLNW